MCQSVYFASNLVLRAVSGRLVIMANEWMNREHAQVLRMTSTISLGLHRAIVLRAALENARHLGLSFCAESWGLVLSNIERVTLSRSREDDATRDEWADGYEFPLLSWPQVALVGSRCVEVYQLQRICFSAFPTTCVLDSNKFSRLSRPELFVKC